VAAAADYKPELIFMDIGLPGLSGHEAAQKIRTELGMTDVYMIALSGYGTEEDRKRSLRSGFNAHLVKPLDPSTLPGLLATAAKKG
jgi:two-component system CheB/CheR fusion protein